MGKTLFALLGAGALLIGAAWALGRKGSRHGVIKLAAASDDSDMKIAGTKRPSAETDTTAEELDRLRRAGMLDRAKQLGAALADKIIDEDGDLSFGFDPQETADARMQRRLLLAFTVTHGVEGGIQNRILAKTVLSRLYDELRGRVPEFYEDIRRADAYSLYTLCTRRDGNLAVCVGRSFAMLSGMGDDPVLSSLGEALFLHFSDVVEACIAGFDFTA